MTANGWLQILFYSVLLLARRRSRWACTWSGCTTARCAGSRRSSGSSTACAASIPRRTSTGPAMPGACCSSASRRMLLTYVVLRLQHVLPLNPQGLPAVPDRQAFETAASFTTNTNWQSYVGRVDDVVLLADDAARVPQLRVGGGRHGGRGGAGRAASRAARRGRLGNFWVDLVRGTLYVLLPLSLVLALILVQQGVIQNFKPYLEVTTLEGAKQTIAMGPGGEPGERSSSSAPTAAASSTPTRRIRSRTRRRGPTSWSMFAIFVIPPALTYTLRPDGEEPGSTAGRCGRRCSSLFFGGVTTAYWAEARGNPIHAARGVDVVASADEPRRQHGGQGGPLRHRQLRAVRHGHDRRLVRRP